MALFFLVLSCFQYVARADDPVTGSSPGVFSISQLDLFKGTPIINDPCNGQCDPHAVCTTGGSCICTGGVFEGNGELCCDTSQGLAYDVQDGVPICIDADDLSDGECTEDACDPQAVCTTDGDCVCPGTYEGNGLLCCDTILGFHYYEVDDGASVCLLLDPTEVPFLLNSVLNKTVDHVDSLLLPNQHVVSELADTVDQIRLRIPRSLSSTLFDRDIIEPMMRKLKSPSIGDRLLQVVKPGAPSQQRKDSNWEPVPVPSPVADVSLSSAVTLPDSMTRGDRKLLEISENCLEATARMVSAAVQFILSFIGILEVNDLEATSASIAMQIFCAIGDDEAASAIFLSQVGELIRLDADLGQKFSYQDLLISVVEDGLERLHLVDITMAIVERVEDTAMEMVLVGTAAIHLAGVLLLNQQGYVELVAELTDSYVALLASTINEVEVACEQELVESPSPGEVASTSPSAVPTNSPAPSLSPNESPSQSPVVGIVPANEWHQLGEDIDGEAPFDLSGSSVAMSVDGNRIAIGAYYNDANGTSDAGHVRVYEWSGSSWDQLGGDLDGFADSEFLGSAVAMSTSGNRVAAGAPGYNSYQGRVRVFDWDGSNWLQVGSDIVGEETGSWSGDSIDLSSDGNRIAIGAPNNDGGGTYSGHVRVYDYTNSTSTWVQVGQDIDGEASYDDFGDAVSLSADGNRVAVGARTNDGAGPNAGHVRVFHWNGTTWVQLGEDLDGENAGDDFGWSVALSSDGSRLAAGGPKNNETGYKAGHVRVFEWQDDEWVQLADDIDGEAKDDRSGFSVAISADGNRVFIGARYNDGKNGLSSGHVRVYDWTGSSWNQTGSDIHGEAANDYSGWSIAASANGGRVAIGAPFNDGVIDTDTGHVRVYEATLVE